MVGFALIDAYPGPVHATNNPGVGVKPELNVRGLQTQTGPFEVAFN